ncbi:putative uncharacterized protein [Collinsella sp. CAG:289]|nr:putative uncharacterized protein [Collinsella sp. CAG:289]
MALGEFLAVSAQNHGDMRERGHGGSECLVDHNLARRVGKVVVAADDVGDAHHGIVDNGREVVRGGAVGAEDDEVVELAGVKRNLTVDGIVNHYVAAILGDLDAQDIRLAGVNTGASLCGVDIAAGGGGAPKRGLGRVRW